MKGANCYSALQSFKHVDNVYRKESKKLLRSHTQSHLCTQPRTQLMHTCTRDTKHVCDLCTHPRIQLMHTCTLTPNTYATYAHMHSDTKHVCDLCTHAL